MIDQELEKFVVESLKEDIQSGDHTSLACINKSNISNAEIIAKNSGLIAGVELAKYIFKKVDNKLDLKQTATLLKRVMLFFQLVALLYLF